MERLTDEELFEIEGGDWFTAGCGFLFGILVDLML